jgi:hypothetical protein
MATAEVTPKKKVASKKKVAAQIQTETPAQSTTASTPAASSVTAPKKKGKAEQAKREVVYDRVSAGIRTLSAQDAKDLLGWDGDNVTDKNCTGTDSNGKKFRCHNNAKNRQFDRSLSKTWESEILQGHWKLNGETIIIGKCGTVHSGQHRLIGLVLAVQEWLKDPAKWPEWKTEPTLETIIVFGIEESDDVVNTIDTGKPRSLADVIYRSDYFSNMDSSARSKIAKSVAYALKMFGHRTGAWTDAFSPRRTHGDSLDLLGRHPKLLESAKHVFDEDGDEGQISQHIGTGYATALHYLMSCSTSNPAEYREAASPEESLLDFANQDKADDFIVLIANPAKECAAIRQAVGDLKNGDIDSVPARCAIVVNAWNCFVSGKPITVKSIMPEFVEDDDGNKALAETVTVGGIDAGNPSDSLDQDTTTTTEELDEDSETADDEAEQPETPKKPGKKVPVKTPTKKTPARKKATGELQPGETVYVEEDGGYWEGTVKEVRTVKGQPVVAVSDLKGKVTEHRAKTVTREEPQ